MHIRTIKQFFFVASLFVSRGVGAQPSMAILGQVAAAYRGEDAVVLSSSDQITISFDEQRELSIKNRHSHQTYFMTGNAKYLSDEQVPYSTFNRVTNLKATYYEFNGSRFRKQNISDIVSVDRYAGSIFYDDSKSFRVVFPNIMVGSVTSIDYEEAYTDPHVVGNFYFSSYIPVDQATVSVEFPAGVDVKYAVFNDNGRLVFEEERLKNSVKYTWTARRLPRIDSDGEDFSVAYYEPHVSIYISSYVDEGKKVDVLPDKGKLYEWVYSFSRDVNKADSPELRRLVDSLTAGAASDYEKARAIFYWVQSNIKYVAIEAGYSGITPRDAVEIFQKRYGDCKDMSSLQAKMYSYAGLTSHLAWVGTRDIPYTYDELPTSSVNNHMVAAVEVGGKTYFCDATAYFISLDFPSDAIQGKQAMVGIDSARFEIRDVPVVDKERNSYVDSTTISLDGDTLRGTCRSRRTGYFKFDMALITTRTPETKLPETLNATLQKGSNKFHLVDCQVPAIDRDRDFDMSYSFSISGYVKKVSTSTYLNMNLDRDLQDAIIDTARQKFDKKIDYKHVVTYVTTLRIPPGYKVSQLPCDKECQGGSLVARSRYSLDARLAELTHTLTFSVDQLTVKPSQFASWNEFINTLRDIYSQVVVLEE